MMSGAEFEDRKKMEAALRESGESRQTILGDMEAGHVEVDLKGDTIILQ